MSEAQIGTCLDQIRDTTTDAFAFVDGFSKGDFFTDKRTQKAVVMSLVITGEAAAKLMDRHPQFVASQADLPRRSLRGMRNRIPHGYYDINLDVVWDTVRTALPDLLVLLPSQQV